MSKNKEYVEKLESKISKLIESVENEDVLKIFSNILNEEFGLRDLSKLVECGWESGLTKENLLEYQYSEGNEECGCIELSTVLNFAEEVLDCCDDEYGSVDFQYFVRKETEKEAEESEHSDDVEYLTKNEIAEIKDLQLQFRMD